MEKNEFIANKDFLVYTDRIFLRMGDEIGKMCIVDIDQKETDYPVKFFLENTLRNEPYKAIIPRGTKFELCENLRVVYPEMYYLTYDSGEVTLDNYYSYGVDVCLKNGKRCKVTDKYDKRDVLGIFAYGNRAVSIDLDKKYSLLDTEKDYIPDLYTTYNGKINTDKLKELDLSPEISGKIKDEWYIPSIGELSKVFENFLRINLTLHYLTGKVLERYEMISSSTINKRGYAQGISFDNMLDLQYLSPTLKLRTILFKK